LWGLVVSRNQNKRGAMSIQFLVILVPVLFGMMGFAVDLGRLYLIRGELNQAASAMALAAAAKLNGTSAATDTATAAANSTLDDTLSDGNRYNVGSLVVGNTNNALLNSVVRVPAYYATASDAIQAASQTSASSADGTTARHVAVNLSADAPLVFWSLLTLGQSRKTSIAAAAVAGVSAPLCTACGIEPFAAAALSAGDSTDFGFVPGTIYTFSFQCTGGAPPALLAGTTQRIPYLIIDRLNSGAPFTEDQQLFRVGAQGLLPSTTPALACSTIGGTENIWATAAPGVCSPGAPNASVRDAMCGLSSRLADATQIATCAAVTNVGTIAGAYSVDTDLNNLTDYTTYAGDNRRVMTLPVVNALSTAAATMQVIGFRQFLLEPGDNPADGNSRFAAMYLGTVAPVRQGRFDGACGITTGPGKVVLHR
jgi:Flp pilus assembly protein TadG